MQTEDQKPMMVSQGGLFLDEIKLRYHMSYENFIPFKHLKSSNPNMTNKFVRYKKNRLIITGTAREIKDVVFNEIDENVKEFNLTQWQKYYNLIDNYKLDDKKDELETDDDCDRIKNQIYYSNRFDEKNLRRFQHKRYFDYSQINSEETINDQKLKTCIYCLFKHREPCQLVICGKCKRLGHFEGLCPLKKEKQCAICGSESHFNDCLQLRFVFPINEWSYYMKQARCINCHRRGHFNCYKPNTNQFKEVNLNIMEKLEKFQFQQRIKDLGRGAYSEVKIAFNKELKKFQALKIINIAHFSDLDVQNMTNEIKIHQTLQHPHIIQFYEYFQVKNMLYIVTEVAINGILFFLIRMNKGLDQKIALKFFFQIVQAINYLHKQGIAHRDIKPENILIDNKFNTKICDFGWATRIGDEDVKQSVCGTTEYMPPEVTYQTGHDISVDIWQLGILLYEMVHGYTPYKSNRVEEMQQIQKMQPIAINQELDPSIKDLLKIILKRNPNQRPSAEQILSHKAFANFEKVQISHEEILSLYENYKQNTRFKEPFMTPDFVQKIDQQIELNKKEIVSKIFTTLPLTEPSQKKSNPKKKILSSIKKNSFKVKDFEIFMNKSIDDDSPQMKRRANTRSTSSNIIKDNHIPQLHSLSFVGQYESQYNSIIQSKEQNFFTQKQDPRLNMSSIDGSNIRREKTHEIYKKIQNAHLQTSINNHINEDRNYFRKATYDLNSSYIEKPQDKFQLLNQKQPVKVIRVIRRNYTPQINKIVESPQLQRKDSQKVYRTYLKAKQSLKQSLIKFIISQIFKFINKFTQIHRIRSTHSIMLLSFEK